MWRYSKATVTYAIQPDRLVVFGLSANEQYFSLTPNQSTVLSAMAYKPNQPKRTGQLMCYLGLINSSRGLLITSTIYFIITIQIFICNTPYDILNFIL